ncbi:WbqC-like protein family protein [Mucilaginibacter gossypiicola]|uniref:WbqC-like protein family protein n=1 Tax=Mucilaginibacter gossypiicola TaxID=551995 RepID=A0A1H7ZZY5_9SPHI|nr:WbqC family protein [Mucilaginibacter gossypiicola]SEM63796.1 WbqC-like protein family protein [Mucilaginibacter gossypiicola]
MIEKGAVLPMFYLPPVDYFVQLNTYKPDILIEREEHFPKQTYRNRANIYSPDGMLALVVPVIKGSKNHTKVKDVKISYDFMWQRLHWQSLQACYRRSAYFEFYEDDFAPFYEKQITYLFDYNQELLNLLLKLTKIKTELNYTDEYQPEYPNLHDFRFSIHPKRESEIQQKPYFQVFEDRKGFMKNLSIIDLLFNQGPQTINYL